MAKKLHKKETLESKGQLRKKENQEKERKLGKRGEREKKAEKLKLKGSLKDKLNDAKPFNKVEQTKVKFKHPDPPPPKGEHFLAWLCNQKEEAPEMASADEPEKETSAICVLQAAAVAMEPVPEDLADLDLSAIEEGRKKWCLDPDNELSKLCAGKRRGTTTDALAALHWWCGAEGAGATGRGRGGVLCRLVQEAAEAAASKHQHKEDAHLERGKDRHADSAHMYRAVLISHMQKRTEQRTRARTKAVFEWAKNPSKHGEEARKEVHVFLETWCSESENEKSSVCLEWAASPHDHRGSL